MAEKSFAGDTNQSDIFVNDYYVISKDFKLVSFNETVAKTYDGIKVGDYCYKATMKRDTPCLHCPIAGNSFCDCPVYYDPFYKEWIEAIFSRIDDEHFAVCCRVAKDRGMRVFDDLGQDDNEELIRLVSGRAVNSQIMEIEKAREKHIKEVQELNDRLQINQTRLEELAAEQEAQIEEISSLNLELQNKQKSLEESACDQEAQLQEIRALNTQLEENQVKLEESAAKQEAQIQDISTLNRRLGEFNKIIANAEMGVWKIYIKEGEEPRMRADDTMKELLGIKGMDLSQEEIYKFWFDRITPEALESVEKSIGSMTAGTFSENTYRWIHPEKGVIYVNCGGTMYIRQDGTKVYNGFHRDTTESVVKEQKYKEELQEALQKATEAEEQIQNAYSLIECLSHDYYTIWLVDRETLQMSLVRTSGVLTLYSAVEMVENNPHLEASIDGYISRFVDPTDKARLKREVSTKRILKELDKNGIYEVNFLRRDEEGGVGYHQVAFANADTRSGKKQFVIGFRDVDGIIKEEQKQKKELIAAKSAAEAANQAKSTFLNNMSHDIRTPMNAILGFASLMENAKDDPDAIEDYVAKIKESGEYLRTIINNVLDLARIESGKTRLDESVLDNYDQHKCAIEMFESEKIEKGITTSFTSDITHRYLYVDIAKRQQITVNLLSNAFKYTPRGGTITMDVKEIPCDREGYATIVETITDTGIGMSEEFQKHIFDDFSREHNTTESKVIGTGLGMSIVKKLVDLMGGTIEVKSELGKGTQFIVTLTHRIADVPEEILQENKSSGELSDLSGRRILLAEDNEFNAEIAIALLEDLGAKVEHAIDGVVCVDMLSRAEEGYYDLVLMDIQMPNMDGYKATSAIRGMKGTSKCDIPIVAVTADAFAEDRSKAFAAGMNGHIAKPIDVTILNTTICDLLS